MIEPAVIEKLHVDQPERFTFALEPKINTKKKKSDKVSGTITLELTKL